MTTAPVIKRSYRPRRTRSGNPPPMQITPRDIDILRLVHHYRFLHSGHITLALGGSPKNIRNRLKALFEHGLLDRPERQYDQYQLGGGSLPTVYALADKGARLLKEQDGLVEGTSVSWKHKNKAVGTPFLNHTLAIADFALRLQAAVQERPDIELRAGNDLLSRMSEATQARAKPLRLSVPVIFRSTRHTIGVEADYAFSLGFPALKRRAHFLCEIDRGTMPVERSDVTASSILRKFLAYSALWRSQMHTKQFGWRNFRVLLLTTGHDRVEQMCACLRQHISGQEQSLFWFADKPALAQSGMLEHEWIDGAGDRHCLHS